MTLYNSGPGCLSRRPPGKYAGGAVVNGRHRVIRVRRGQKRRPYWRGLPGAAGRGYVRRPGAWRLLDALLGSAWLRAALVAAGAVACALAVAAAVREPPGTPLPTAQPAAAPVVTASATPEARPAAVPTGTPTPEPEPLEIDTSALSWPKPSLKVDSREALIDVFWWMIYTGTSDVSLKSLSLKEDDLMDVTDKFSNYFDAFGYRSAPPRIRVTFKPGTQVLLAVQKGEVDKLDEEDRAVAEQAQAVVSRLIRRDMSDLERELAIHDYIVNHCEYLIAVPGDHVEDVRGFFKYGLCQCVGYADTFRLLARLAGLEVEMIGGPTTRDTAGGKGHAWNLIRLDGKWYVVDPTWDDQAGGAASGEYIYFNLPQSSFGGSRSWDQSICPDGDYADAVDGNYYYARAPYAVAGVADGVESVVRQLETGSKAYLYFTGEDAARAVSAGLVEHYGRQGSCLKLSGDLELPLYRFALR